MADDVETLIEFEWTAWVVVAVYTSGMFVMVDWLCVSAEVLVLVVELMFVASTVYIGIKTTIHHARLQEMPRKKKQAQGESRPRSTTRAFRRLPQKQAQGGKPNTKLWTPVEYDRWMFPLHSGAAGAFPWNPDPDEDCGYTFLQAMIFFQLFLLMEE